MLKKITSLFSRPHISIPNYQELPIYDNNGYNIPWAKNIFHSTARNKMHESACNMRGNMLDYNLKPVYMHADPCMLAIERNDAKAYISALKANGQMMGEYVLAHGLKKVNFYRIPIVYLPDSGIVTAKGVAQAFKNKMRNEHIGYNYKNNILPALEQVRPNGRHEYALSDQAMVSAMNSGHLILCDGTLETGESMASLIDNLCGQHLEVLKNLRSLSVIIDNEILNNDRTQKCASFMKSMQSLKQVCPKLKITFLVASRNPENRVMLADVGNSLAFLRDHTNTRQDWGQRELQKRPVGSVVIPAR